jgi:hypothetical protein
MDIGRGLAKGIVAVAPVANDLMFAKVKEAAIAERDNRLREYEVEDRNLTRKQNLDDKAEDRRLALEDKGNDRAYAESQKVEDRLHNILDQEALNTFNSRNDEEQSNLVASQISRLEQEMKGGEQDTRAKEQNNNARQKLIDAQKSGDSVQYKEALKFLYDLEAKRSQLPGQAITTYGPVDPVTGRQVMGTGVFDPNTNSINGVQGGDGGIIDPSDQGQDGQYEEGVTYVDKSGGRARYENGQFTEID